MEAQILAPGVCFAKSEKTFSLLSASLQVIDHQVAQRPYAQLHAGFIHIEQWRMVAGQI